MLASITPLGERGRGASWPRAVTAYVVGSLVGGAVMGSALGAAGSLLPRVPLGLLAVAGLLALAADLSGRLPALHRQVDENWLVTYRDWVYGAGFGLQLGLGAVTIATSASTYLVWVLELSTRSAAAGALVGAVFGLARALPLLTAAGAVDPESLRALHRRWQRALSPTRALTVAAEATTAVACAVGAVLR